jgi:DNA-binding protein HU-beta
VNKSELVENVAAATDLEKRQAEAAVDAVIAAVIANTRAGNKVALFGFGTFAPTSRAARVGRNPQTGAAVKIAASKGVKFSPATAFKAVLNPGRAAKKSSVKKVAKSAKKAAKKR